jgi:hypothetical protein
MTHNWAGYEGRFAGTWRLDSFLGDRDSKAFYMTADVANTNPALLEVIPVGVEGAEAARKSWDSAGSLSHEGLLKVYESGKSVLDDLSVFFAVLQLPDNDVGEILSGRTLDLKETRAMLSGAAAALDYLHQRDLHHGSVTPSNVFLVGDVFKLSVDTITAADKAGRQSDMRQLGSTLIESVTRSKESSAARKLPPPFREIATGCLEPPGKQWTADRVLQTLSGRTAEDSKPGAGGRRWMLPAAAVLAIVALLGYWVTRKNPEQTAIPKTVEQPVPTPAAAVPAATLKPSPLTPVPNRSLDRQADRQRGTVRPGGSSSWSVIAATYNSFSSAQHRADQIKKLSSQLKTHVYPPDGQAKTYYVVLGSNLTQEAATDLRDRARHLGAPGDTYVTKLGEK